MPEYMPSKKIKEVVGLVEKSEWILPTFQRKYVWDQEQICDLFDSIMRGYPISTFMIWKVEKKTAANNTFYKFLTDYQEWWREIGEQFTPKTLDYYYAVIDGQQRINSLYIGYCGSYATKLPRVHWKKAYDESIQPKTYLYLNLVEDADENTSRLYDFRFFSDKDFQEISNRSFWYRVGDILKLPYIEHDDIDDRLPDEFEGTSIFNDFSNEQKRTALKKLKMLYKKTFHTPIINYYQEDNQNLERVVDVFVRANGGGTPLEFSDLVMSVTVRQWPEAKDKIEELIKLIYAETGIALSKDFVLKVFLTFFSKDISFQIKYFEDENLKLVNKAKAEFDKIHNIILGSCKFINQIGLNNDTLRSKYALIPLVYFSYKNNFDIGNVAKGRDNHKLMDIWIKSALLKGMFGGKPDAVLQKIKGMIDSTTGVFPTQDIFEAFKNTTRDIRIDEDFIRDKIEKAHYGSIDSYLLLTLATKLDPQQHYHVDHMYPKDMFKKQTLKSFAFLNNDKELLSFYDNKNNWNTVGNLQLLNASENTSKNKSRLSVWTAKPIPYKLSDYFVPMDNNSQYIVADNMFKEFVSMRKELLVKAILNNLNI
ncbi:MAG: DUF262 domain-containing protein [Clostridia bacterium]|nr:DUF262 domain-containing protein [Clostridia bacterium]